jgi:uncharacterized protein YdhG (YjbR/CyaY superfamily)
MKIEPRSPLPSPKQAKPGKPKTPDEYLCALSDDQRGALEALRAAIRAAAPRAEECISYDRPAFRLNRKLLVTYGAAKNHCAFYAGSTIQSFVEKLKNYNTSKGTIRFRLSAGPAAFRTADPPATISIHEFHLKAGPAVSFLVAGDGVAE